MKNVKDLSWTGLSNAFFVRLLVKINNLITFLHGYKVLIFIFFHQFMSYCSPTEGFTPVFKFHDSVSGQRETLFVFSFLQYSVSVLLPTYTKADSLGISSFKLGLFLVTFQGLDMLSQMLLWRTSQVFCLYNKMSDFCSAWPPSPCSHIMLLFINHKINETKLMEGYLQISIYLNWFIYCFHCFVVTPLFTSKLGYLCGVTTATVNFYG